VLVSWLGGEPALWGPLWKVSRTFREEYGLRLGITTHGRELTSPQLRERLIAWFDRVTVSLDGDAAFHDQVRRSPGLFDRLAAGVSALAEAKARQGYGPLIHVNTVLMRANLPLFEQVCETAAAWGAEELTFNNQDLTN
jgi:MoaA/NifB/PqqE/SkfB family radical SAM enzyme